MWGLASSLQGVGKAPPTLLTIPQSQCLCVYQPIRGNFSLPPSPTLPGFLQASVLHLLACSGLISAQLLALPPQPWPLGQGFLVSPGLSWRATAMANPLGSPASALF